MQSSISVPGNTPELTPAEVFPGRNYFMLAVYWFAISFLWGGFLGVVLPALNKPLASQLFGANNIESVRGIMSGLGLIIAMFVQPLAGAISDRSASKYGRRRPFMLGGTLGILVALAIILLTGNWWFLLLGYITLQFADNLSQGAYQGLMPDVVPEDKRGKASAALAIAQLVGSLFGAVVPGILQGTLGEIPGSQIDLVLVGLVFVISLGLTSFFIREKPFVPTEKISAVQAGLSMFRGLRQYPDFIRLMLARFLFLTAPATVSLFVKSFLEDRGFIDPALASGQLGARAALKMVNDSNNQPLAVAEAGGTLSLILGIVILAAIIAAYPFSLLSERYGRKKVIYIATAIGLVGGLGMMIPNLMINGSVEAANLAAGLDLKMTYLKAVIATNQAGHLDTYLNALSATRGLAIPLIILFGACIGGSWGAFMAVDWAFATDLIPLSEAGRFMGLSNLATAGCQALGAFLGGFIVDSPLGYTGLFIVLVLYYILSIIILTTVRETRSQSEERAAFAQPG